MLFSGFTHVICTYDTNDQPFLSLCVNLLMFKVHKTYFSHFVSTKIVVFFSLIVFLKVGLFMMKMHTDLILFYERLMHLAAAQILFFLANVVLIISW